MAAISSNCFIRLFHASFQQLTERLREMVQSRHESMVIRLERTHSSCRRRKKTVRAMTLALFHGSHMTVEVRDDDPRLSIFSSSERVSNLHALFALAPLKEHDGR